MKSYKYLVIDYEVRLEVRCTDEKVIEWIVSYVKELVPKCDYYFNFPEDSRKENFKRYSVRISKLDDKDEQIEWMLMEQLGQQGWEPFAVQGARCVHFRLATEV